MEITILSQYFYPEVAATGQLLTELAIGLKERGCRVKVVTGQPSYAGRERLPKEEAYKGIDITRVWNTSFNKNKKVGRMLNSLSFFFSAIIHLAIEKEKSPLLIVSNPPFLPAVGAFLKTVRGRKYIFLVHDVYPEIAVKLGYLKERGLIARVWEGINKMIYQGADRIIVLGESMGGVLAGKVDKEKIEVIHNWADGNFIKPLPKNENPLVGKYDLGCEFVVLYSGNIGMSHDLETVIEAASAINDIKFVFIGEGGKKEKLVKMAEERGLTNVLFLPYQQKENLPHSLTLGDVSVVSLEKGLEGLAMPSKIYSYLAAGQAIIGLVGEDSEIARIIKECNCGYRVDQGNADGFIKAVSKLQADRGLLETKKHSARKYFKENFEKEKAIDKYFAVLKSVD